MYEHRCLKNIKKTSCKCDDQQQYKTILEAVMVSTTEGCTDNSPMTPNQYYPTKKPIERKVLRQFSEALYVKHKTDVHRLGVAKENHKVIRTGNVLWSNISKNPGH